MQFREEKWYSSQNIFILTPNDKQLVENKLYIIAATNKALKRYNGGYNDYPTLNTLKDLEITLPITTSGDIDFQYMQDTIHELEQQRIHELETYLIAAGFTDCNLTTNEQTALNNLPTQHFKLFKIDELFEKIATKRLGIKVANISKVKTIEQDLPVLTAGIINQGLVGFVSRKNATVIKNVISVSANGANTGAMFYQPDEFTVLQDSYAIQMESASHNLGETEYLYLVACLQKSVRGYYDWSNKAGWEKIKDLTITLPTTPDNSIDYDFITDYINAIKKSTIQNLKDFIQQEHQAYLKATN